MTYNLPTGYGPKHMNLDGLNKIATQLLKSFFNPSPNGVSVLINDPVFLINHIPVSPSYGGKGQQALVGVTRTVLQVTVQLSYYQANKSLNLISAVGGGQTNSLNAMINALTQLYESSIGGPVNVQLELVRQYRPYMDAAILAQYLAINASKHGFNRMMNLLLNAVPYFNPDYAFNLSCITGVKVQLSGLLTSQRNRSRKSVYTASAGTFSRSSSTSPILLTQAKSSSATWGREHEINNQTLQIDYANHTTKSRLGAFTVKVWIASSSPLTS